MTFNGYKQAARTLCAGIAAMMLSGASWAATAAEHTADDYPVDEAVATDSPSLSETELMPNLADEPRINTHASMDIDPELLKTIRNNPEQFTDKLLRFDNGQLIGTINDLRRRKDNLELYFIVDATEFFNNPVEYAVMAKDIERLEGDMLVMEMDPGMHLRGLVYYPDDYTAVDDFSPDQKVPSEFTPDEDAPEIPYAD